ncbi:MAG: hypothetical protein ACETVO_03780 [bacterium]
MKLEDEKIIVLFTQFILVFGELFTGRQFAKRGDVKAIGWL